MMSDGNFRSQAPQQQQLPPQQYPQHQSQQGQPAAQTFQHQLQQPQQLLANVQAQQPMTIPSQQPYNVQQQQTHAATGAPPNPSQQHSGTPSSAAGPVGSGQPVQDSGSLHPFARAKSLAADLKQSLQILMKTASEVAKEAASDSGGSETPSAASSVTEELRRSMDNFDAICNQIEGNFMLLQELHRQQSTGDRFTPAHLLPIGQKDDVQQETGPPRPLLSFKDYEDLTRLQTGFATSVRDNFLECSRILND